MKNYTAEIERLENELRTAKKALRKEIFNASADGKYHTLAEIASNSPIEVTSAQVQALVTFCDDVKVDSSRKEIKWAMLDDNGNATDIVKTEHRTVYKVC